MGKANGRLKLGMNGNWLNCEIGIIGFGNNYYIRMHTKNGTIDLYGLRHDLSFALRAAADIVDGQEPAPLVTDAALPERNSVTNMTPAEVETYFRNSPELASIADDVAAALKDQIGQDDQTRQDVDIVLNCSELSELVSETGEPVYGAQARISQALGIPNAGSYRERILKVLEAITSTTTQEKATGAENAA